MPAEAMPPAFLGTWKLTRVEATPQHAVPLPREGNIVFSQEPDGIHYVTDTVYSDGKKTHTEAVFRISGSSYPVIGSRLRDALSVRKNGSSLEVAVTRAGKPFSKACSTVSADGKVMKTDWELVQPDGAVITYTTSAERQG